MSGSRSQNCSDHANYPALLSRFAASLRDLGSTESPLEGAAGAAGPDTTEAFQLLANETWLTILLALWEAKEPHSRTM